MNKAINLQDVFLNQCRKEKIAVTIFLTNGFQFKGVVKGEYGTTPTPIDPEFRKKIIGDDDIVDYRPADKIAPEIDSLRQRVAPYQEQGEDLLSLALFEQVAIKYFDWRKQQKYSLDANADAANGIHAI